MTLQARWWEPCLSKRRVLGATFVYSRRSSTSTVCRTQSMPTVTRSFGPIGEPTIEEQLKNQRPSTEVGRGLQELGVTLIPAGSPQAKGRIERLWGTFQDRLVSELRRAGAKTQAQAQVVLERYLPEHNRKFSKPALSEPAWRKTNSTQIQRALCFKQ